MVDPRESAAQRLAAVDELDLVIEKLVAGGDGLGRFEGIPIFVPRSAPGDRLRVRLVERRPDYARGEILEILDPGPGRRTPPCPHFSRCGGCDLQHLEDKVQTRLKAEALVETLQRVGGIQRPDSIRVHSGKPFRYRLRTQLQTHAGDAGVQVGYFARGSHDLVPIDSCPILVPELDELLPGLPDVLSQHGAPRRLDLAAGDGGAITLAPVVEGLPHGEVRMRVGEAEYAYDARCFFQGHRDLVPKLVEEVVGDWTGEVAVDLYAGVGLFSIPLCRRYERVFAVESEGYAARYARNNGRRNKAEGLEVVGHAVETWLSELPRSPDRVIVDPPRGGLTRNVRKALVRREPKRLTYVSCHPAALARDLRFLQEAFRVESLTVLDLFPQTGHMEAVVQLVLLPEAERPSPPEPHSPYPRDSRPSGARPSGPDRPRGDRPYDRPRGDRPYDRPRGDRPYDRPRSDRPRSEQPRSDRRHDDRRGDDRPRSGPRRDDGRRDGPSREERGRSGPRRSDDRRTRDVGPRKPRPEGPRPPAGKPPAGKPPAGNPSRGKTPGREPSRTKPEHLEPPSDE